MSEELKKGVEILSSNGTNCSVPPVLCECTHLNHALVLIVITILGVSGKKGFTFLEILVLVKKSH